MRSKWMTLVAVAGLALTLPAAAHAQLSAEVRGSYTNPLGDFGDRVDAGPGFGADLIYSVSPAISVYGGWSKDWYGCECDGDYSSSGFEAGVKAIAHREQGVLPWGRVGLILHHFSAEEGGTVLNSDYSLGFQVSGGVDIPLSPAFSLSPAVRYQAYGPNYDDVDSEIDVSQISIDLGLHVHLNALSSN